MKNDGAVFTVRKKNDVIAGGVLCLSISMVGIVICLLMQAEIWSKLAVFLAILLLGLLDLLYSISWKLEVRADSIRIKKLFRQKEYSTSQIKRVLLCSEYREGMTIWVFWQDGKMLKIAEDYKNFERFHRYIQKKHAVEWK